MNDKRNFIQKNWLTIVAIIYLIWPTDIIWDQLPIVGNIDDSILFLIDVIRRYIQDRNDDTVN